MTYTTCDFDDFAAMIKMAVQAGLCFEAYPSGSNWVIKYTGNY